MPFRVNTKCIIEEFEKLKVSLKIEDSTNLLFRHTDLGTKKIVPCKFEQKDSIVIFNLCAFNTIAALQIPNEKVDKILSICRQPSL